MFSDSQGSDSTSEQHGFEKQFCGPDFLVGASGDGGVATALFEYLHELAVQPGSLLTAATIESNIQAYMANELQPVAHHSIELLVVTPHPGHLAVQHYSPGIFKRFGRRTNFTSIGSGAEFVFRAFRRDKSLGIERVMSTTIADALVALDEYADAANESLTVDDKFLVGYLIGNRTYLMGDSAIPPMHAPREVLDVWPEVSQRFKEIMGLVRTIRGELGNAYRAFSSVAVGTLDPIGQMRINQSCVSVQLNRVTLQKVLHDYFAWYDALLGRAVPAP